MNKKSNELKGRVFSNTRLSTNYLFFLFFLQFEWVKNKDGGNSCDMLYFFLSYEFILVFLSDTRTCYQAYNHILSNDFVSQNAIGKETLCDEIQHFHKKKVIAWNEMLLLLRYQNRLQCRYL